MTQFETRVVKVVVAPEGDSLFSEQATSIEIEDEGGGEFLIVTQPTGCNGIRLDAEEWHIVKDAIDNMVDNIKRSE